MGREENPCKSSPVSKIEGRNTVHADLEGRGNTQILKGGEKWAKTRSAGWIVDEGGEKGVRVASWLIKQQNPICSAA